MLTQGAPHPDQRLLMLLRMLREFGFILADCEGCQPPSPGLMGSLAEEHGLPFSGQRGRPEESEDDWQPRIAGYLTRQWGMEPPDVFVVLRECEADEITRADMRYLLLDLWERHAATVVFVTHSIAEAVILSDRVVMLAARPGRVVAIEPIDLARPRTAETEDEPAFHAHVSRLRHALREGHAI